jgi:hypothetical protein
MALDLFAGIHDDLDTLVDVLERGAQSDLSGPGWQRDRLRQRRRYIQLIGFASVPGGVIRETPMSSRG